MRSPRPIVTAVLATAMLLAYFGFQEGQLTLGTSRAIEFRCNAIEYGLIPYEITHPGAQLTDPYCQPQPEALMHAGEEPAGGDEAHEHPRSDPGIVADAPAWLTPLTSMFMHGGLLQLGFSVLFLLIFGPRLERHLGRRRFLALFALAGLATAAALIGLSPDLPIATLGATGAVAGVMGAHLALLRGARLTWFELPATALLGVAILLQLAVAGADAAQPVAGSGGDVAYLAPATGLIVGLLVSVLLAPARGCAQSSSVPAKRRTTASMSAPSRSTSSA
jgi:membrane associated rhomboid family serine protease